MTTVPVLSKQEHSGELLSAGEEAILLRADSGEKVRIPLGEILKAVQEVRIR
jgi:ribosome maturation factor RimP